MDIIKKEEATRAVLEILYEYGIKTYDDWYNQDEQESLELYESMKAGVIEVYDISDDDMENILGEILE